MKLDPRKFRVTPRVRLRLKGRPTDIDALYKSGKQGKELLAASAAELGDLQRLLYAAHRHSVLLIFQGMDAAGKDGAISQVLKSIDPQGCEVHSFRAPSAEERAHDFLWRTTCRLPARGRIGVFNRSYYEEVLVVRVHPELLLGQDLPPGTAGGKSLWAERYRSIVDFEDHLRRNGTVVLKFFLHLSKGEQRQRLLARIDEPARNWKIGPADATERRFWSRYRRATEAALAATSTRTNPWYVVPADDKPNARLIISRIVIAALRELKSAPPRLSAAALADLKKVRRELARS